MVAIGIGLIAVGYWIAWAGTTQSSLYDAWRCQATGARGPGQQGVPTDCAPRPGDIKLGAFIWRPQSPNLPAIQLPGAAIGGPFGPTISAINDLFRRSAANGNAALAGANGVLVGPCL